MTEASVVSIAVPAPSDETVLMSVARDRSDVTTGFSKLTVRTSLKASTWDGVFAAFYTNTTTGVLLINFLLELGASPTEIGVLAAIPMLANLVQPIGAYFSEKGTSRRLYSFWLNGTARLLWWGLASAIGYMGWQTGQSHGLIFLTLGVALSSAVLSCLGSASWLSWMVMLVPRRLRGRYFSIRNSAATLTNLISIPLTGWLVSRWLGGAIEGFGLVLMLGSIAGMISLVWQGQMADINPQALQIHTVQLKELAPEAPTESLAQENLSQEKLAQEKSAQENPSQENLSQENLSDNVALSATVAPESLAAESLPAQPSPTQPSPTQSQPLNPLQFAVAALHQRLACLHPHANAIVFLGYFSTWMFAINLSTPFYNLFMLDRLHLDIGQVTLYNSFTAAANLMTLVGWGKLADRIGNRPILIGVGVLVAITPLLWLPMGTDTLSIWLWLPLLHLVLGGTWAAIDLCVNNLQLGIAPTQNQATYFGISGALSGVTSALGTLTGGFLAQFWHAGGGLIGLFILSALLRLMALLPLIFVQECRSDRS